MNVLVTAAGKHEATAEIADLLGETLRDALREAVTVDVLPAERVSSVDGYDAVVFGSAVYAGHWLGSVRELAAS